jgi:ankyrin repeat protein
MKTKTFFSCLCVSTALYTAAPIRAMEKEEKKPQTPDPSLAFSSKAKPRRSPQEYDPNWTSKGKEEASSDEEDGGLSGSDGFIQGSFSGNMGKSSFTHPSPFFAPPPKTKAEEIKEALNWQDNNRKEQPRNLGGFSDQSPLIQKYPSPGNNNNTLPALSPPLRTGPSATLRTQQRVEHPRPLVPPEELLRHQKHNLELKAPAQPDDARLKAVHLNIERINQFIKTRPTFPKELFLNVIKVYEVFLGRICTPDLKVRTQLLTQRARLRTEGGMPYLVPVSLAREIIAKDAWGKKLQTDQEGGQSTVVSKGGTHFKDGAASVNGIKPPYEWAVYSFGQLLLGQDYTPPTTTFCLERTPLWSLKGKHQQALEKEKLLLQLLKDAKRILQPLQERKLLSEAERQLLQSLQEEKPLPEKERPLLEEGKKLLQSLQERKLLPEEGKQLLQSLQKEKPLSEEEKKLLQDGKEVKNRLNEKVFFSLNPVTLDDYFDEYPLDKKKLATTEKSAYVQASRSSGDISLLEFLQRPKEQRGGSLTIRSYSGFFLLSLLLNFTDAKDDNLRLLEGNRLISIDNDRVFGNMVVADGKGEHWIEAKNILFLMQDEINTPVDDFIVQKILNHDPDVFLLEWLKTCAWQNQQYEALYNNSLLPEGFEALKIQFQPETVLQVKERLATLQRLLRASLKEKKELPTHEQVFQLWDPLASKYYAALRQQYPDPHEAQNRLWKAPTFKELLQPPLDPFQQYPRVGSYEEGRTQEPFQEAFYLLEKMDIAAQKDRLRILDLLEGWLPWPDHWPAQDLFLIGKDVLGSQRDFYKKQPFFYKVLKHRNFDPALTDDEGNTLLHLWVNSSLTDCGTGENSSLIEGKKKHLKKVLELWSRFKTTEGLFDALNAHGESILDAALVKGREELVNYLLNRKKGPVAFPYLEKNLETFYEKVRTRTDGSWKKSAPLRACFRDKKAEDPYFRWTLQRSKILTQKEGAEKVQLITRNPYKGGVWFVAEERYLTKEAYGQLWDQNAFKAIHENSATQRKVGRVLLNEPKILQDAGNPQSQKVRHSRVYFKQNPASAGTSLAIMELETALFGTPSLPLSFARIKDKPFTLSPGVGRLKKPIPRESAWEEEGNFHKVLKETESFEGTGSFEKLYPLDEPSIAKSILMAILTNPEDDKPSNFVLEKLRGKPFYTLTSIDTEQAFVPSVAKPSKEMKGYIVEAKSILYCLDHMGQKVPPSLNNAVGRWDVIALTKKWVGSLKGLHHQMKGLFKEKEHHQLEQQESPLGVPFAPGEIGKFICKLLRLQGVVAEQPPSFRDLVSNIESSMAPSFMDILRSVEPFIGKKYQRGSLKSKTPLARFKEINGPTYGNNRPWTLGSREDFPTSTSAKNLMQSRNIPTYEEREKARQQGYTFDPAQALKEIEQEFVNYKVEELLKLQKKDVKQAKMLGKILAVGKVNEAKVDEVQLNLKGYLPHEQALIFECLKPLSLDALTLRHSLVSSSLAQMPTGQLTVLDLTGGQLLEASLIRDVLKKSPNLTYLDLSLCGKLAYLADGTFTSSLLAFPQLKGLKLNGCNQLKQIHIQADKLEKLEAGKNPRLVQFLINAPSLNSADLSDNQSLTDSVILDLIKGAPGMKDLNITGCPQVMCTVYPAIPVVLVPKGHEQVYERFLKGVLIYKPNEDNDDGRIVLAIKELKNPLEGTFDLSQCGDTGKYLSISTGYRKVKNPKNADRMEIWFAPRFLVEQQINGPAKHFKRIFPGKWPTTSSVGIFWTWGGDGDLDFYDYLTNQNLEALSNGENLYKKWAVAGREHSRWTALILRQVGSGRGWWHCFTNFMFVCNLKIG